jgi:uncharacterized repeat protein (TIGR03803 family)
VNEAADSRLYHRASGRPCPGRTNRSAEESPKQPLNARCLGKAALDKTLVLMRVSTLIHRLISCTRLLAASATTVALVTGCSAIPTSLVSEPGSIRSAGGNDYAPVPASHGRPKSKPLTVLYSFEGNGDGFGPYGGLYTDSDGDIFGTTSSGGASGHGAVFELMPTTSPGKNIRYVESPVYSFKGEPDGSSPMGTLIQDSQGTLYGTTASGGKGCTGGCGTIFSLTPAGESVIYEFLGMGAGDGAQPMAGLAINDGVLYGTTMKGGTYGHGTIFSFSPADQTETVLYSFSNKNEDGGAPEAPLTVAIVNDTLVLYGSTSTGGRSLGGIIFQITPSDHQPPYTLHNFHQAGLIDGSAPLGPLSLDPSTNTIYGTASKDGKYGLGMAYSLPVNYPLTYAPLHQFAGASVGDGANPWSGLSLGKSGKLYGTTAFGGSGSCIGGSSNVGCGTIFELKRSSQTYIRQLWRFQGSDAGDGAIPYAGVLQDSKGDLFGVTFAGGATNSNCPNGCGTAFELP